MFHLLPSLPSHCAVYLCKAGSPLFSSFLNCSRKLVISRRACQPLQKHSITYDDRYCDPPSARKLPGLDLEHVDNFRLHRLAEFITNPPHARASTLFVDVSRWAAERAHRISILDEMTLVSLVRRQRNGGHIGRPTRAAMCFLFSCVWQLQVTCNALFPKPASPALNARLSFPPTPSAVSSQILYVPEFFGFFSSCQKWSR